MTKSTEKTTLEPAEDGERYDGSILVWVMPMVAVVLLLIVYAIMIWLVG